MTVPRPLKISIPLRDGWLLLPPDEIAYIKSDDMYCYLYTGEQEYFVCASMKALGLRLEKAGLVRCHRSYLVNLSKVQQIIKTPRPLLILDTGSEIPLSRTYRRQVLDILVSRDY